MDDDPPLDSMLDMPGEDMDASMDLGFETRAPAAAPLSDSFTLSDCAVTEPSGGGFDAEDPAFAEPGLAFGGAAASSAMDDDDDDDDDARGGVDGDDDDGGGAAFAHPVESDREARRARAQAADA